MSDAPDPGPDAPAHLTRLLQQAEQAGASDIHLQMTPDGATVAFRLDGLLAPVSTIPSELAARVFGRIKFLARLKTYDDSLPQDGRIDRAGSGTAHDVRVATYPTVSGEKIVLRLFHEQGVPSPDKLELPDGAVAELNRFLRGTSGLLLLTGPAGSGKTTTIYACLRQLAETGGRQVVTVEDPVEQVIPGITQTEVNEARGLGYAVAARHLLRLDPQVLVLGEIRDDETAGVAVRAAFTGHLVISTLHAGSCRGVFERLALLCPDRYAAGTALRLILNQRLLRRLCPACSGRGCPECSDTGYRGRVPAVEWLRVDDVCRAVLAAGRVPEAQPACSLAASARDLLARGLSDSREYERVLGPDIP